MLWAVTLIFVAGIALIEGLTVLLCRAANRDMRRRIQAFSLHPNDGDERVGDRELDEAAREAARAAIVR